MKRIILLFLIVPSWLAAHIGPTTSTTNTSTDKKVEFRSNCALATATVVQDINNVRARLLNGGDVWWDGENGQYIVPKVAPGQREVSSIFAASVWLGGYDPSNNLKMAAKTFGTSSGETDFWPGPLDPTNGTVNDVVCKQWDRFFEVSGDNIRQHIANYNAAITAGQSMVDPGIIPLDILGWPARGNEFFVDVYGFELPNTDQGLASFFDRNGNELYEPQLGEYPVIEIRGCPNVNYADQMIYWVYNDAGGVHSETQGNAIQMEVQVQAFSYATNDEINNMTFQRYKLINRAITDIDSCFFGLWVDPDLGCPEDDLIGCDVGRSLAYVYNQDATDGQPGCDCAVGNQNIPTYCDEVPILGVDYFRGPLDENGAELGMSSFVYYNRTNATLPAATTDPDNATEYYRYLTGSWKDGTPFTVGGSGYQGSSEKTRYVFPDDPDLTGPTDWSMCNANVALGDRRTIQASGPFLLRPGAVNELIVGVVWVPDMDYPCPNISRLKSADDAAQAIFDNCFKIADGPDAPDLSFVALNQKIVCTISNNPLTSNNAKQGYAEVDFRAPAGLPEDQKQYRFEGYKIYQLANSNVSSAELSDPNKAVLIYQADIRNKVDRIFNWVGQENPLSPDESINVPELKVDGENAGIKNTFEILQDQFAVGDASLINNREYHFMAIAYGYNNYEDFQPSIGVGQRSPYIEGRRNIRQYTIIPRENTDLVLSSDYGDGPKIIKLDGNGSGGQFLNLDSTQYDIALNGTSDGVVTYANGAGPVAVRIYNPRKVPSGKFFIRLVDETGEDLSSGAYWQLLDESGTPVIERSDSDLDAFNEQLISDFGFSIDVGQVSPPGSNSTLQNGAVGMTLEYDNPNGVIWFDGIADDDGRNGIIAAISNFIKTNSDEIDFPLDPNRSFSELGDKGYFFPYSLSNFRTEQQYELAPAWHNTVAGGLQRAQNGLKELTNVDIVFTSDKSKWSQCVVLESANEYYYSVNLTNAAGIATIGGTTHMQVRRSPSVLKDDLDGDGFPDPDPARQVMGYAWFPGYAINVETGKRVNIMFAENSTYRCEVESGLDLCAPNFNFFQGANPGGDDMMFGLNDKLTINSLTANSVYNNYLSGTHYIYVTDMEYDGCESLHMTEEALANCGGSYAACESSLSLLNSSSSITRARGLLNIKWAALPVLPAGTSFLPYAEGLIPNDLTIKIRVDKPFIREEITGQNNGFPFYELDFTGLATENITSDDEINEALEKIQVVPNPYYGFSDYERNKVNNVIKVTNLPRKANVTIYTLDGKFIRQYTINNENEAPADGEGLGVPTRQFLNELSWDMRNSRGVPISSGVYLIHVEAPGLGEKVLKWFGVNRKFDPSGL